MSAHRIEDSPKDPLPKVLAAIRELREGHKVGRSVLRKFGLRAELGEHQIEQVALEHGRTPDSCRKLRQFAELYSPSDLRELCGLCRRYHRAFRLSLLYKIVSIENRKDRREFQKRAIAGHWGHAQLSRELRTQFGRRDDARGRKQRGRKPAIPNNLSDALVQLEERVFGLVRWQEHFAEMVEQGQVEQLPPSVSRKLQAAIKAARALYESASRSCERSAR